MVMSTKEARAKMKTAKLFIANMGLTLKEL